MVYYGNPCIRVSEKENLVLFLGFLRQFLQTEFQPRIDLKMYLNRWTTQKCYFNYSDSGRNLLKATEKKHRMYIQAVHAQGSIFLRQLHVSNILCVLRFYLAHAHVFTTTFIVICNLL